MYDGFNHFLRSEFKKCLFAFTSLPVEGNKDMYSTCTLLYCLFVHLAVADKYHVSITWIQTELPWRPHLLLKCLVAYRCVMLCCFLVYAGINEPLKSQIKNTCNYRENHKKCMFFHDYRVSRTSFRVCHCEMVTYVVVIVVIKQIMFLTCDGDQSQQYGNALCCYRKNYH